MALASAEVGYVGGRILNRHTETGSANTELITTLAARSSRRVVAVIVSYSAAPTQGGVTTTLDSGAGAAFDAVLDTGAANARYSVYHPTDLFIGKDDALVVTAPAGGVGITASIAAYTVEA